MTLKTMTIEPDEVIDMQKLLTFVQANRGYAEIIFKGRMCSDVSEPMASISKTLGVCSQWNVFGDGTRALA
jgi:hypothetical protein